MTAPATNSSHLDSWALLTVAGLARDLGRLEEKYSTDPVKAFQVAAISQELETLLIKDGDLPVLSLMDLTARIKNFS